MDKYRYALAASFCIVTLSTCSVEEKVTPAPLPDSPLQSQIDLAQAEINRRFIDPQFGIIYDYAGRDGEIFLPTPEECLKDQPNALSWWTPMENGAFFSGIYLDGLCNQWKFSQQQSDKLEATRVANGLVRLATIGSTPGFIARGVASDGKSHYIAGSDDQTSPWFYGMWRYIRSGIPDQMEKARLANLMQEVATALESYNWLLPCDREGYGFRGNLAERGARVSSRLVFVYRALYDVTKNKKWLDGYYRRLQEIPEGDSKSRLQLCSQGIPYETVNPEKGNITENNFWITAVSQACLKALVEMEDDPELVSKFRQGLDLTAQRAILHLSQYKNFVNDHPLVFNVNWRLFNHLWKPQPNINATVSVALEQLREWNKLSPARHHEDRYMREPLFACWVVVMSGNKTLIKAHEEELKSVLMHYGWKKLYTSRFFIAIPVFYEAKLMQLFE